MPEYILKTESIGFMPFALIYENELSASVFVLMPVLILFVVPLAFVKEDRPDINFRMYLVLFVLLVMQVLPISVSMATAARYYYDFLPIMMIMAYLGALWLKRKKANIFRGAIDGRNLHNCESCASLERYQLLSRENSICENEILRSDGFQSAGDRLTEGRTVSMP